MVRGASWRDHLDRAWFSWTGVRAREAVAAAAGLLSPSWCVGCGAEETDLCEECAYDVRLLTRDPYRAEADAPALPVVGGTEEDLRVLPVIAAGTYGTLLSRVMLGFKDHERILLDRVLAPALGRAVGPALRQLCGTDAGEESMPAEPPLSEPPLIVVPPLSLRARTRRSHDPVRHLLGRLAGASALGSASASDTASAVGGAEIAAGLVVQRPQAAAVGVLPGGGRQKGRGLDDRRRRLSGAFRVTARGRQELPGRQVLLVDDVLTTGSTVHALYEVLTEAGAEVRGAAVMAAAEVRRGGDASEGSGLE